MRNLRNELRAARFTAFEALYWRYDRRVMQPLLNRIGVAAWQRSFRKRIHNALWSLAGSPYMGGR